MKSSKKSKDNIRKRKIFKIFSLNFTNNRNISLDEVNNILKNSGVLDLNLNKPIKKLSLVTQNSIQNAVELSKKLLA